MEGYFNCLIFAASSTKNNKLAIKFEQHNSLCADTTTQIVHKFIEISTKISKKLG